MESKNLMRSGLEVEDRFGSRAQFVFVRCRIFSNSSMAAATSFSSLERLCPWQLLALELELKICSAGLRYTMMDCRNLTYCGESHYLRYTVDEDREVRCTCVVQSMMWSPGMER